METEKFDEFIKELREGIDEISGHGGKIRYYLTNI